MDIFFPLLQRKYDQPSGAEFAKPLFRLLRTMHPGSAFVGDIFSICTVRKQNSILVALRQNIKYWIDVLSTSDHYCFDYLNIIIHSLLEVFPLYFRACDAPFPCLLDTCTEIRKIQRLIGPNRAHLYCVHIFLHWATFASKIE